MSVLERVRDLVVLSNDKAVLELSLDLRELTKEEQRTRFGGSRDSGWFYLHANDQKRRNMVFECIVSETGETVSALYMGHPIFNSVGELLRVREELVREIGEKVGLDFRNVGVTDPIRGREVGLEELATGQLIDLLTERTRGIYLGKAENDSYGLDHVDKIGTTKTDKGEVFKGNLKDAHVLQMQEDGTVQAVPIPQSELN